MNNSLSMTSDKTNLIKKPRSPSLRRPKGLIGWREWAALPDLEIGRINAKIDTGAKSSAIHAFDIREVDINGVPHVEFTVHPVQRRKKPAIECVVKIHDVRVIRSSNGMEEERYVIKTPLSMAGRRWKIDLTLANRDSMGFRLLLGRDALRRKFQIDPGKSFLLGR